MGRYELPVFCCMGRRGRAGCDPLMTPYLPISPHISPYLGAASLMTPVTASSSFVCRQSIEQMSPSTDPETSALAEPGWNRTALT